MKPLTLIQLQKLKDQSSEIISENEKLVHLNQKLKDTLQINEKHLSVYQNKINSLKGEIAILEKYKSEKNDIVSAILGLQDERRKLLDELDNLKKQISHEQGMLNNIKEYREQFV